MSNICSQCGGPVNILGEHINYSDPRLTRELAETKQRNEELERDAKRLRLCLDNEFPRFNPGRKPRPGFSDHKKLYGEYIAPHWKIEVGGKTYTGSSAIEAIDAALAATKGIDPTPIP